MHKNHFAIIEHNAAEFFLAVEVQFAAKPPCSIPTATTATHHVTAAATPVATTAHHVTAATTPVATTAAATNSSSSLCRRRH